jgi:hypothetical protein
LKAIEQQHELGPILDRLLDTHSIPGLVQIVQDLLDSVEAHDKFVVLQPGYGVGVGFRKNKRYAQIELFDDGIMYAMTVDRTSSPDEWEVEADSLPETIDRFRDFLTSGPESGSGSDNEITP